MPLVSATQLSQLRAVAYQGLDTEVTIERPTQVETDFGSEEQFAPVATTLAWVREMSTSPPGNMLGVVATTGLFRIHMRHDVGVQPHDRITINGDGVQLTVTDVNSDNTIRIYTTVIARRVE
jgi:hypothetical protein